MAETPKTGPLQGLTVIEMAGLGPVPLAGLMLADMGADVLRIERISQSRPFLSLAADLDLDRHGRSMLRVDLKQPRGAELVLGLAEKADVLIEGFRPGVMERLGLGPEAVLGRNPRLVYGRLTGFGQDGPLAARAGHDITYLALSGALHAIGRKGERPVPPVNFIADYGGGTMMLLTGVLAALVRRGIGGKGQVVDAAMVEGAATMTAYLHSFMAGGLWRDQRGVNLLDGGAPFYDTYETADGRHVAVGCLEPQFFAAFARLLPLDVRFVEGQYDTASWPAMRQAIADRFKTGSRDDWAAHFSETDACVAPVLSLEEAVTHPQSIARAGFAWVGAFQRPAPTPRFSATPSAPSAPPAPSRADAADILSRFGWSREEVDSLRRAAVVG